MYLRTHFSTRFVLPLSLIISAAICGFSYSQNEEAPRKTANATSVEIQPQTQPRHQFRIRGSRRLTQMMQKAEELLQEKKLLEAVQLLQKVVESPEDFLSDNLSRQQQFISLKTEAELKIGRLSKNARKEYEREFGTTAASLLNQALKTNDVELLEEIAGRFFHTAAGYKASHRMASYYLDHAQPVSAVRHFNRLLRYPQAVKKWEPLLTLKTAISYLQMDEPDESLSLLKRLRQKSPKQKLSVGGEEIPWFGSDAQALGWLNAFAEQHVQSLAAGVETWTMFRGSPARNVESPPASPLGLIEWSYPTIGDQKEKTDTEAFSKNWISETLEQRRNKEILALPAMHPLVVGNVVVFRTLSRLKAVDLTSGQLLWATALPDPAFKLLNKLKPSANGQTVTSQQTSLRMLLAQRSWSDLTAGTLSTDGKNVYALEHLGMLGPYQNQRTLTRNPLAASSDNRLVAYELVTGKVKWEIGGPRVEFELDLAGAFFLGPPLPIDDSLFCLAENSGEIRLLELNPQNGQVVGSQSVYLPEYSLKEYSTRRLTGLSPSYCAGVIICPTTSGSIIAIDVKKKRILWAFQYRQEDERPSHTFRRMAVNSNMMRRNGFSLDEDDHWLDTSITVVKDRILLTPHDADSLYCISLFDGKLLWQRPRNQAIYLETDDRGLVILVGRSQVEAIQLADGRPAWSEPTPISAPSGRGFRTLNTYVLPLSSGEIASIELKTGRIRAHSKLPNGQVPGNLISSRGTMISQSELSVTAFRPLEKVTTEIEQALAKNSNDSNALTMRGELRLHQGKEQQAMGDLALANKLDSKNLQARSLIVKNLQEGLRFNFTRYRNSKSVIDQMISNPQERAAFYRLYADSLLKIGEKKQAFQEYLKLTNSQFVDNSFEQIGGNLSVRRDRWVTTRINELLQSANDVERAEMDKEILARFETITKATNKNSLSSLISFFNLHPQGEVYLRRLLENDQSRHTAIERETILKHLQQSANPQSAGFAIAKQVQLLLDTGRPQESIPLIQQLAKDFSEVVCLNGQTGKELSENWLQDARIESILSRKPAWLVGQINIKRSQSEIPAQRSFSVQLETEGHSFLEIGSLRIDQQKNFLLALDQSGSRLWEFSFQDQGIVVPQVYGNSARIHGHLMVLILGNQFLVLDLSVSEKPPQLLWKQALVDEIDPALNRSIRILRVEIGGGLRKLEIRDPYGRYMGRLGPVNDQTLVFQKGTHLYVAESLTGNIIWERRNVPRGTHLFGDLQHVIAVQPLTNRATVYRLSDGTELDNIPLEEFGQRLMVQGRNIVTWTSDKDHWLLKCTDILSGELIWQQTFAQKSRVTVIENQELAVLEQQEKEPGTAKFSIWDAATGTQRLASSVDPETDLAEILVLRSQNRYTLLTNGNGGKIRNMQVIGGGFSSRKINGKAYGFNRKTGQQIWATRIDRQAISMHVPAEFPLLIFHTNRYQFLRAPGQSFNKNMFSILVLDQRNGKIVLQEDRPKLSNSLEVDTNPESQRIDLLFDKDRIELTLTDKPVTAEEKQSPTQPEKAEKE